MCLSVRLSVNVSAPACVCACTTHARKHTHSHTHTHTHSLSLSPSLTRTHTHTHTHTHMSIMSPKCEPTLCNLCSSSPMLPTPPFAPLSIHVCLSHVHMCGPPLLCICRFYIWSVAEREGLGTLARRCSCLRCKWVLRCAGVNGVEGMRHVLLRCTSISQSYPRYQSCRTL